jgi:hypothetical protein
MTRQCVGCNEPFELPEELKPTDPTLKLFYCPPCLKERAERNIDEALFREEQSELAEDEETRLHNGIIS